MRPDITADNEYHTPENTPHLLVDRLTFNSRFIFTALFLKTVFKSRYLARNKRYGTLQWVETSHDIFTDPPLSTLVLETGERTLTFGISLVAGLTLTTQVCDAKCLLYPS